MDPDCITHTHALRPDLAPATRPRPAFVGPEDVDVRLALFACAADRARAESLLDSLAETPRNRAAAHLRTLLAASSSERQGQLARAFGIRSDAADALREVWEEAGPALRREVFVLLPPYLRSLFASFNADEAVALDVAPGLAAFAERLVREATR